MVEKSEWHMTCHPDLVPEHLRFPQSPPQPMKGRPCLCAWLNLSSIGLGLFLGDHASF